jgi:hypothetical protein
MYSWKIKARTSGLALVLLLEPIPRVLGQQPSSDSPAPTTTNSVASPHTDPATDQLPDSPGTVHSGFRIQPLNQQELNPATVSNQQTGKQEDSDAQNPAPVAESESSGQTPKTSETVEPPMSNSVSSPPQRPHEPMGTAAAESVAVTGVAASRPAGAAVAPAKQRRVRSILIKVGAVVGVGVAVGTTMALSQGSPSRPPGSR